MQVSAFCFNWTEVRKRTSPEQIVAEMIHSDDIDIYAIELPDGVWSSDSASQHFQSAEEIALALGMKHSTELQAVSEVVSMREALDELGISSLTEGCYFISISPERIQTLLPSFERVVSEHDSDLCGDTHEWINQWRGALEYAAANQLGIIGHCG